MHGHVKVAWGRNERDGGRVWVMSAAREFAYIGWTARFYHILLRYPSYACDCVWYVCDWNAESYSKAALVKQICPIVRKACLFAAKRLLTAWRRICCHFPGLYLYICIMTLQQEALKMSCDNGCLTNLQPVLSVNDRVASGLAKLRHGEGWFGKSKRWSEISMWALVMRCSCEEL